VALCRYGCVNGNIFMPALGRMERCPDCQNKNKALGVVEQGNAEVVASNGGVATALDYLLIPDGYRMVGHVGPEIMTVSNLSAFTNSSVGGVFSILGSIQKSVYEGGVYRLSTYIHTSNNVDIRKFVYSTQMLGVERGLGVTPYVSLNTLISLEKANHSSGYKESDLEDMYLKKTLSSDLAILYSGIKFVRESKITYYDFYRADLCFLEATASTSEEGFIALADLLAERTRFNLPTYVIGYWGSKSLSTSGLRFLLAKNERSRLDKLNVYEVLSRKGSGDGVGVAIVEDAGTVQSKVKAGVFMDSLLKMNEGE